MFFIRNMGVELDCFLNMMVAGVSFFFLQNFSTVSFIELFLINL